MGEVRVKDAHMETSRIRKSAALALCLTLIATSAASAAAATASGPVALALAAVVAQHSPLLAAYDKQTMARLFAGDSNFFVKSSKTISVTADEIVCRTSNVDIAARSCEMTFKASKRRLKGAKANELFAILATAGVAPEGAAGSNFENISKLNCTIDPDEIRQKSGGGADCSFETAK
jgi:hypothetical protein